MTSEDTPRDTNSDPDGGSDSARADRPEQSREDERDAVRRRRRARVFGDELPETTRDERADEWGDRGRGEGDGDEWLRRQVPPHHG